MIKGPPPKKTDPNAASNAQHLRRAWSIVGCVNGIAMLLLAVVFLSVSGYTLEITWAWIVGVAVFLGAAVITMIWQMKREEK